MAEKRRYSNPTDAKKFIDFPEDFEMTFKQFEESFENSHVFRDFEPKTRAVELKKAFNIATKKAKEEEK